MFIEQRKKEGKPVSASSIEDQRISLFSEKVSPHEILFGGRVLQIVSSFASQVALSHSESLCQLKGVDFIHVFSPAKREDILICSAAVNRVWRSLMEIGVKILAEDFRSLEQRKILSAYFTFTVLDEKHHPSETFSLIPESLEQKKRYIAAEKRRLLRENRSQNLP